MKLHYLHLPRIRCSGVTNSTSLHSHNRKFITKASAEFNQCDEEFVSNLLNRRWTLQNPDAKIHQVMLSRKRGVQTENRFFGEVNFSLNAHPELGNGMMQNKAGNSFYVVRDDLLHPLVNGNKARKLDAFLPIVEDYCGTDVVTCGGCQSAHTAAVAVSCAERGVKSHLLLRGEEPEILTGYNLISSMYGNVVYLPRSVYAKRQEMLLSHAEKVAGSSGSVTSLADILESFASTSHESKFEQKSADRSDFPRKVVVLNEGAGDAVALLGVIRLVHYLSHSNLFMKEKPLTLVIDAGTGTTAVGLALGALCLGLPWKITAVMLADTIAGYKQQEKRLVSDFNRCFARSSNHTMDISNTELVSWVDRFNPRRFGNVLDGEVKACQQVASQTGILIDPMYTLAAWEAVTALCQETSQPPVVVLHTGGTLGMFGLAQRYKSYFKTLKDELPR
ncbi:hypothetical protein V2J09_013164 [Rumex salicifolius]